MRLKMMLATVLAALILLSAAVASAEEPKRYEANDLTLCGPESYKGWPADWWATYFIREFDKYAPAPGIDWLTSGVSDTGRRQIGPAVSKWVNAAEKKGWVVKRSPQEAMVGAIAIRYSETTNNVKVYLVNKIYNDKILVFQMSVSNGIGTVTQRELTYEQLGREIDGFKFYGYIWPQKSY